MNTDNADQEDGVEKYRENSLMRHGERNIAGVLPLVLTPSSLGLGQDDRVDED